MNAEKRGKCLNPRVKDSLLCPLITVSDLCSVHSKPFAQTNWTIIESRVRRYNLFGLNSRPTSSKIRLEVPGGEAVEASSDGGTSDCPSPKYTGRNGENRVVTGDPMEMNECSEDVALRKEKDAFMDEIVDLIRNVKKYNDAAMSSSPTWIDKLLVDRIAKQLIMIQNYLPELLKVEEIVHALLFENGPAVMGKMIIEMPENIVSIVNSLIKNPTPGTRTRYRNLMIGKIINLYPYFARKIINKFSERRSDCVFACRLAVDHLSDKQFLEFMEPMLTEKDTVIYKIVVRAANRQILPLIVGRLLAMADAVNSFNPESNGSLSEMGISPWCTSLSYCLVELIISSMEPWKEQEIVVVTKFVFRTSLHSPTASSTRNSDPEPMDTSFRDDSQDSVVPDSDPESAPPTRPPKIQPGTSVDPSPFGEAHECFVLAALVAVPFFTQYIPRFPMNQTGAVHPPDQAVDDWLEMSRRRVLQGEKITTLFGTKFIYVHSCIFSSRTDLLTEFASEGMKQQIDFAQRQNHASVLKNAFNTRSLTDLEVAKRSVCQKVTPSTENPLPLRSVNILQEGSAYTSFQISIESWLEAQLDIVTLPVSTDLEDIIDSFAKFCGISLDRRGISQNFIKKTFSGDVFDENTLPKRLLVLLYLCSYRESAHRLDASLRHIPYDISIFQRIPVRYLLSIMDQRFREFEGIRAKIMTRISMIFPYSLPTPDSMRIVMEIQRTPLISMEQFENQKEQFMNRLRENKNIQRVLDGISRTNVRNQLACIPIFNEVFMDSLNPMTPPGYELSLMSLFDRYEQLNPFPLFYQAVSTWIRHDTGIDVNDIIKIPSLLFRCDSRILSSPPHFHCFVRALNFFNKKARADNRLKLLECQSKSDVLTNLEIQRKQHALDFEGDRKEKELLTGSYLDTQHSILIHGLIEVCDSKRMKDDPTDFVLREKRQQIRRIAFEYIHRTFLDHEGLIRVVLYQKLPLHQVRDLVEGIPSLFAGIFQIQDMLTLADQQRRFFAIVFAAEIGRKYRVQESLNAARTVLDFVHSVHKFGELPPSYKIWKHVAPALMTLATQFPSLADSINRLLIRVSTAAKNRLAVRCGLFAGDPRNEEYLLIDQISSFLDRNSTRL
uniref:BTB domain-containing protein n=1 Tax=Caenorhabditis tropicalis TaxID=1561998 RepID=A0A1I7UW93_9PELO